MPEQPGVPDAFGSEEPSPMPLPHGTLAEVTGVFLRLGCTAFGGPAAHVAMMRREIVEQRRWVSEQEFLDLFGAANLIPGPSSTELAILLGYRRAGWRALLLAGGLFILPAMLLVYAFAWAYVRYGTLPAASHLLYGVKPVIIAIITLALWGLRRTALKGPPHVALAALAAVLLLVGFNPLPLLFGGGLLLVLGVAAGRVVRRRPAALALLPLGGAMPVAGPTGSRLRAGVDLTVTAAFGPAALREVAAFLHGRLRLYGVLAGAGPAATAAVATATGFSLLTLFLAFLTIGASIYGSGYVLLAFLRDDFVTRLHWLTNQQLIDAVAVGQFTPGPVFTTATFIGYLTGGWTGGLVATLGIFLPSFFFCAIVLRLVPLTRRWPLLRTGLDGVNAAALGLMAAVTLQLGHAAIVDPPSAMIVVLALVLLLRFGWNSAWFVLAGALAGLLIKAGG